MVVLGGEVASDERGISVTPQPSLLQKGGGEGRIAPGEGGRAPEGSQPLQGYLAHEKPSPHRNLQ